DALTGRPVDAELLCGDRAEHGDRQPRGTGVEPVAACEARAEHRQEVQAGRPYLEATGLGDGDDRAAVDERVLDQGRVRHLVDVVEERDAGRCLAGQLYRAAGEALPGLDSQQVRAELVDLRDQPGLPGGGQ